MPTWQPDKNLYVCVRACLCVSGGRCLNEVATIDSVCLKYSEYVFTAASPSQPVWLDDVMCDGYEESLAECLRTNWGTNNCGHKEDAGCICEPPDSTSSTSSTRSTSRRTTPVTVSRDDEATANDSG